MGKKFVKYFVVDAFTDSAFKGNPAAVCLLEYEKDEKWLQAVAAEFNISETCYLTPITTDVAVTSNPRFRLRWFTPVAEVNASFFLLFFFKMYFQLVSDCSFCG
jgi:PhzF family phenazine biosynthesis protein